MHRLRLALTRFAAWLSAHRKPFLVLGSFLVVVGVAAGVPQIAYAIDPVTTFASQLVTVLALVLDYLTGAVGWFIIKLIEVILVPILNYDGFATSRIIGLGWSLVRDTVNMFVVIILLVIAILTIVGSPRANWQQQIPRLFIYVIAVNFSRTICGFLLDIGNVIMFQFVNAILDVGAGNFAQLLKINIAGQYSTYLEGALMPFQQLGAAYLQLALLLAVAAVLLLMTLVFLYRIVVLWVLIILSPAAFFMGGIKDIVGQAGSAYGDWWKKFSSAIILGPLLTFFLWLALAAASSGDIVTSENFPVGDESESSVGLVLKLFDVSQITGLLLGLVLLVVGMQQASSAAGALGGLAAKFINEGMAKRIVGGALKWPATGYRGGKAAAGWTAATAAGAAKSAYGLAQTVAPDLTSRVSQEQLENAGRGLAEAGRRISSTGIPGAGLIGRRISELGVSTFTKGHHIGEERDKAARDLLSHAPDGYRRQLLRGLASAPGTAERTAFDALTESQRNALVSHLATNRAAQRDLERNMPGDVNDVMTEVIRRVDASPDDFLADDAARDRFDATQARFADLLGARTVSGAFIANPRDFKDPRLLRAEALTDADVRNALRARVMRTTDDGREITAWDEMLRGAYGNELRAAAQAAEINPAALTAADFAARGDQLTRDLTANRATSDVLAITDPAARAAFLANARRMRDAGQLTDKQQPVIANPAALTAGDFTALPPAGRENLARILLGNRQTQDLSNIADAGARMEYLAEATRLADAGDVAARRFTVSNPTVFTAAEFTGPQGEALTQRILSTPAIANPAGIPNVAARNAYATNATRLANSGQLTPDQRAVIDVHNVTNPNPARGNGDVRRIFSTDGRIGQPLDRGRVDAAIQQDAGLLNNLSALAGSTGVDGDLVRDSIVRSLRPDDIAQLARRHAAAAPGSTQQVGLENAIQTAATVIADRAMAALGHVVPSADQTEALEQLQRTNAALAAQYRQLLTSGRMAGVPTPPI